MWIGFDVSEGQRPLDEVAPQNSREFLETQRDLRSINLSGLREL